MVGAVTADDLVEQYVAQAHAGARLLQLDSTRQVCAAEVNVVNPQRSRLVLEACGPISAGVGDIFAAVLEDHVASTPNR